MVNRRILNLGIHVATALALLVAVMTSPIRPSRSAGGTTDRGCLRRNYSLPPSRSTYESSGLSQATRVKALRPEGEGADELSWAARPAPRSWDVASAPRPHPPRPSTAVVHIPASRPLRC